MYVNKIKSILIKVKIVYNWSWILLLKSKLLNSFMRLNYKKNLKMIEILFSTCHFNAYLLTYLPSLMLLSIFIFLQSKQKHLSAFLFLRYFSKCCKFMQNIKDTFIITRLLLNWHKKMLSFWFEYKISLKIFFILIFLNIY